MNMFMYSTTTFEPNCVLAMYELLDILSVIEQRK